MTDVDNLPAAKEDLAAPIRRPDGPPRRLSAARSILTGSRFGYLVLTAIVLFLVVLPVGSLLYSSLKPTTTELPFQVDGFSFGNFIKVFQSEQLIEVTKNTAIYVTGSVVLCLVLSTALAYLIERTDLPGRSILGPFVLAPMAIPGIVLVIAWLLFANPTNGPFTLALGELGIDFNIYTLLGMVIVTGVLSVPGMYLMIAPQFTHFNTELEEVAATSGAGWFRRMRSVVLPLVSPGVAAGTILLTVLTLEEFAIPAILGTGSRVFVFSSLVQDALQPAHGQPNYGKASAYGVVLLVLTVFLFSLYRRRVKNAHRFSVVKGAGYRPTLTSLGRWRRPAFVIVIAYMVLGLFIPILTLLWVSFLPYVQAPGLSSLADFTLDNYRVILSSESGLLEIAKNTAIISVLTATLTVALATWLSVAAVRGRFRGSWLLLESTSLLYGVPSVILGAALLFFWLSSPIPIYGTIWILILAFTTRFMARATRMMQAGMLRLDDGLEDIGRVMGASTFTTTRKILVPLLWPSVSRAWLWVFVHAMGELPIALILGTGETRTVVVFIWQLFEHSGSYPQASALAILLTAVSTLVIWIVNRTNTRAEEGNGF